MRVYIVINYVEEPIENENGRFKYLAYLLAQRGHNVSILTSTFGHMKKEQKGIEDYTYEGYAVKHFYEGGYPKNICLKRFASHAQFARNIKKYLVSAEKPDLIYLAVPSLKVGTVCVDYCTKNNVKLVVDVQDLWPEAFKMVFNPPVVGKIVYWPFERQANKIYRNSDAVVAVSKTYVDRALCVNKKCKSGLAVYLGTRLSEFDEYKEQYKVEKDEGKFVIGYCGTLGRSYNIEGVIRAMKILADNGYNDLKFKVLGDGPLRKQFEQIANELKVDAEFKGYLPYKNAVAELCACDIAINCIVDNSAASIINKVGDYAAAALPVVNTQKSIEYRDEIEKRGLGVNCDNNNIQSIADAIEKLYNDKSFCKSAGSNNRLYAEECFNRAVTYPKIIEMIENL